MKKEEKEEAFVSYKDKMESQYNIIGDFETEFQNYGTMAKIRKYPRNILSFEKFFVPRSFNPWIQRRSKIRDFNFGICRRLY
jgi:hypothetical protein